MTDESEQSMVTALLRVHTDLRTGDAFIGIGGSGEYGCKTLINHVL